MLAICFADAQIMSNLLSRLTGPSESQNQSDMTFKSRLLLSALI